MSNTIVPSFRTYHIDANFRGVIAEFPTNTTEYLKAERFDVGLGINWTTDLSSMEIPDVVQTILPGVAKVEVWHKDRIEEELTSEDAEGIMQAIALKDTIRLTYAIEPGLVSKNGLLIAWRIRHESVQPPYQLGVLASPDDLTLTRSLIEFTATPHIVNLPGLLDRLRDQV